MNLSEKTINSKTIFKGKIINLKVDEVRLPNGKISSREIVNHPGGVAIVALTDKNKILLVRQYRKPVEEALLELPAGKLEYNENPIECAKRELIEETGYKCDEIKLLTMFYTTPGFSDEKMYLYFAKNLKKEIAQPDEDEFLELYEYDLNELKNMISENKIKDAKTVIGILLYSEMVKVYDI